MDTPAQAALLDTYIGAALSASNDLVATLCNPMGDMGIDDAARRVLLLLWISDGTTESEIGHQLHAVDIESTLEGLEQRGFVMREASSVWLTAEGRELWTLCGTEEMERRLSRLQREIVALRDVLQSTVGFLATDGMASGNAAAVA